MHDRLGLRGRPAAILKDGIEIPVSVELWTVASVVDSRETWEGRLWTSGTDLLPVNPGEELDLRLENGTIERIGLTGTNLQMDGEEYLTSLRFSHKRNLVSLKDYP